MQRTATQQKEPSSDRPKRAKSGGRKKGTPNKVTAMTKNVVADLLAEYNSSGLMESDFFSITSAKDRLLIAERLMQYVMPKMQNSSIDIQLADDADTIVDKLRELSGEGEK